MTMLPYQLSVAWLEAFAIWRGLLLDASVALLTAAPVPRAVVLTFPSKRSGGRDA